MGLLGAMALMAWSKSELALMWRLLAFGVLVIVMEAGFELNDAVQARRRAEQRRRM